MVGSIILLFGMFSPGTALAAEGPFGWLEGGTSVDLCDATGAPAISPGARKRSNSALAIGEDGEIAVVWANEEGSGLTLARRPDSSGSWSTSTMASGAEAWYPDVVYAGSEILVTWMQGNYGANPVPNGAVMQQNVGDSTVSEIMPDLHGYMGPRVAVGTDDWQHLIFALSDSSMAWTSGEGDLYYSHRLPGDDWASPTAVITGDRAIADPDLDVGAIWFPEIGLSPDGKTVHFVWEQRVQSFTEGTKFQVWYVAGHWQNGVFEISDSTLQQISPEAHRAGRPDITVDGQGRVHITWTEIAGSEQNPGEENIHYQRLDLVGYTTLTEEPVLVNADRPAWTTSVLAAHEDMVCVAWDSFPVSEGAGVGKEEINLYCSRDGGENWDAFYTNVSETSDYLSIFPNFVIDGNAGFHLLWEEHRGGSVTENYNAVYRGGELPFQHIFLPLVLRNSG